MRQRSVSSPRSSNRTCRFPASGFPTGSTTEHTTDQSSFIVQPSLERPGLTGVCRLVANHRSSAPSKGAPEVRVLPSTRVTRLHQYYDPVRLPFRPSPEATLRPLPSPKRVSPVACITLPACRAHYPGGSDGCARRLLPHPCCLPRIAGGSASASSLSRPAQASLTLRPAGLLSRPRRPLSRGFSVASYPTTLLVSYQTYRQLSGWILPPLVIHALSGHTAIFGNRPRPRISLAFIRALLTTAAPSSKAAPETSGTPRSRETGWLLRARQARRRPGLRR
jgi:hypothetical protein